MPRLDLGKDQGGSAALSSWPAGGWDGGGFKRPGRPLLITIYILFRGRGRARGLEGLRLIQFKSLLQEKEYTKITNPYDLTHTLLGSLPSQPPGPVVLGPDQCGGLGGGPGKGGGRVGLHHCSQCPLARSCLCSSHPTEPGCASLPYRGAHSACREVDPRCALGAARTTGHLESGLDLCPNSAPTPSRPEASSAIPGTLLL